MAITNIRAIISTVNLCLNYIKRDKFQVNGDKIERHKTFTSYLNCVEGNVVQIFNKQRQYYIESGHDSRKRLDGSENLAYHMIQSFDKKIDPALANEIGVRLAEEILSKYTCVISTHSNSDYTHNHFLFNAFQMDGSGKWHDCDKTKDLIRKVSDRLCREYGLSVIEERRDYKPVHWVDKDGKKRSYEPTARKSKLLNARISSNQNSFGMIQSKIERSKKKDVSFTEMIKSDIDIALNSASSYTELLQILNKQGYKINSKKKKGGWLKYTSFLLPDGERPIRDSTLGPEYSRERLAERIAEISANHSMEYKTDNPLVNYIRSDITAKSESIDLLSKQKMTSKGKARIEYLKNCINANLLALSTMDKYRFTSFQVFERRIISVTGNLSKLNNRLSGIMEEMLRNSGMSSVLKYNNGWLTSSGIVNIQNRRGIISRIFENGAITDFEYPLVKEVSVSALSTIADMRADRDYAAAKAGDIRAAFRFVRSVYNSDVHIKKIKEVGKKYPGAIIAGVLAEESAGRNKIPDAFMRWISELTGNEYDVGIYQINKIRRTGSSAAYRLANRPKFMGAVQSGRQYILADDVITAGGTLGELRNYIESHGGEVVHIITGAAADNSTKFTLSNKTRVELENRFGIIGLKNLMKVCDIYKGKLEYLTEAEGNYLLHFKSLDRARDSIFEERHSGFVRTIGSIDGRSIFERGS